MPLTTVQAWLGHGSIEVTARYLHHLGDSADRSALRLLNESSGVVQEVPTATGGDSGVILGGL
ncbi:hypothetical protein ACPPVS_16735 [Cellulomonas sp. McL0617]|uniref:hypothetical protein n=1 Tax=Cellulomonas sp. McL0617 TaxID=3415675 RepID=UPI003CF5E60B